MIDIFTEKKEGFAITPELTLGNYINSILLLSIIYQEQDLYKESNNLLSLALSYARKRYDLKVLGIIYQELGNLSFYQGEFISGLNYIYESIKFKKAINNEYGIKVSMQNLNHFVNVFRDEMSSDQAVEIILRINLLCN